MQSTTGKAVFLVLASLFLLIVWYQVTSSPPVKTKELKKESGSEGGAAPGKSEKSEKHKMMHPKFVLPAIGIGTDARARAASKVKSVYDLHELNMRYPDPVFSSIYITRKKTAKLKVPDSFAPKVKSMFSRYPGGTENLNFIENQKIATTYNMFTDEYTMFNEIRRYRPGYSERLPSEAEEAVAMSLNATAGADKCDFCRFDRSAIDTFGRIDGEHCFTASNVAKYEQFHGLVVSKTHNPLTVNKELFRDMVAVAKKWFAAAHEIDSNAQFPHAMYDAGPKASASQLHAHMQISLTQDRYYSKAENIRQAAIDYEEEYPGRNYWQDVIRVHQDANLAVRHGNSVVLSHICPVKERELIVVTEDSSDPAFAETVSMALESMRDDMGTRAFSFAILFKQLTPKGESGTAAAEKEVDLEELDDLHGKMFNHRGRTSRKFRFRNRSKAALMAEAYPALVRIVDRGNPLDKRSDVGAMEFFGANNVGADPYQIIPFLSRRIKAFQDGPGKE